MISADYNQIHLSCIIPSAKKVRHLPPHGGGDRLLGGLQESIGGECVLVVGDGPDGPPWTLIKIQDG